MREDDDVNHMLFRAEALSHSQQDHTEGRILVRSPGVLWGCTIAAAAAAGAIALLLFGARYTPHISAGGRLLANGQAQVLVPASALPYLQRGQRIALRYPALPAPRGQGDYGSVHSVSLVPGAGDGKYQILIAPAPRATQEPLQAGMAVDATVALPEVRLIEWIVRSKR